MTEVCKAKTALAEAKHTEGAADAAPFCQTLSVDDVRAIANYVRIALTDEELEAMTRDLNGTIRGLDSLDAYDLTGVEPTFHPIGGLSNVVREDVQTPALSLGVAVALANAPMQQDGAFLIPAILGDGEGGEGGAA